MPGVYPSGSGTWDTHPQYWHLVASEQYTYYWNAFLLFIVFKLDCKIRLRNKVVAQEPIDSTDEIKIHIIWEVTSFDYV